jgi:hypothetical protein
LPFRKVSALIDWLPPDAAFWRASGSSWSTDTELAAINAELLDSLRRMYLQAHSKRGQKLPDPLHIPRPWDRKTSKAKRGTTLGEMVMQMKLPVRRVKAGD